MQIKTALKIILVGFPFFYLVTAVNFLMYVGLSVVAAFVCYLAYGILLFPKQRPNWGVTVLFCFWPFTIYLMLWIIENPYLFPITFPIIPVVAFGSFLLGRQIRQHGWKSGKRFFVYSGVAALSLAGFIWYWVPRFSFWSRDVLIHVSLTDISLTGLDTESIDLASQKGKVLVLDFWNSRCAACFSAKPEIQKLADKYNKGDKVLVASISSAYYDPRSRIDSIDYWKQFSMPEYYDHTGELTRRLAPHGCPIVAFVNKEGIAVRLHEAFDKGTRSIYAELIDERIQEMLKER